MDWVRINNWDNVFWRTLLGLIIYIFDEKGMQEGNEAYYLRASTIMMDAWEGVSDFTRRMKMKKRQYEATASMLEMLLPIACRWDQIFCKLLAIVLKDDTINTPKRLQAQGQVAIIYNVLTAAHSRVQIVDSEAHELKRLHSDIMTPMPRMNYGRPLESSHQARVPHTSSTSMTCCKSLSSSISLHL